MNLPVVNLIRSLAVTGGTAGRVGRGVASWLDSPGALLQMRAAVTGRRRRL